MRIFYLICSFALITSKLFAQVTTGTLLTGSVVDENARKVEFAAVVLLHADDTAKVVRTTATDTLGLFAMAGVPAGRYQLRVVSLGYRVTRGAPFTVSATTAVTPLPALQLTHESKTLGEVVVKGEPPMVERSLGKLTLNVANSFFNTATNALEVLRRAPGVQVSPLGAITLNGTITPVVYLDGRQLPLTSEELQSISTEDVAQVEITSNASARYDGTARAVINIKLKRDKTLGLRGVTYAGGSLNRRYAGYDAGISSTYKAKKWVYYGRVGFSEINNFIRIASQRIVRQPEGGRTDFDMATFHHSRPRPLSYQASADYSITKRQTVGFLVRGFSSRDVDVTNSTTGVDTYSDGGQRFTSYQLPSTTLGDARLTSNTFDLSYKGLLNDKEDELVAYLDYAKFTTAETQDFRTVFPSAEENTLRFPQVLLGRFPNTTDLRSLRTDYTHSLSKATKMSLGAKLTRTKTDNELLYDTLATDGAYARDASRSNRFVYKENITAGYGGLSTEKGKNAVDAALRVEYTHSLGNSLTLQKAVRRGYYRWLPSLQAQHKFDEQNTVAVTFARKMRRPSFYDLNPFQFYTSPYEYIEGNPFLLPATVTVTELRYTHKDFTVTAGYELVRDQISQLPIQDERTKVIRYTRTNLDKVREVTLTLTAPITLTKWWRMQNTAVFFHTETTSNFDGAAIDTRAWSLLANGQQVFTLPKNTTLEVSYNYSAPSAGQIYRIRSSGTVNVSLQKKVLEGKGNVQLTAADVFNTYRESFYGQFNGIDVDIRQTRNVQQLSARFTYRFGNSTFSRRARVTGSAEDEGRAIK